MLLAGTLPVLDSALPGENLPWWWFRYKEPPMITNLKGARIFQLGVGPVRSYDSPVHQLQERHPSSRQHLDDANQHHLVEGDIIVGHPPLPIPLRVLDRELFAVLVNTVQIFPISQPPQGSNSQLEIGVRNFRLARQTSRGSRGSPWESDPSVGPAVRRAHTLATTT